MPRRDRWRGRLLPAVLGAALLIAPLVVAGHVHARHAATTSSCLLCTAADHGVCDLPIVARIASPLWTVRPVAPAAPSVVVVRPLASAPSRGPPAHRTPSPH